MLYHLIYEILDSNYNYTFNNYKNFLIISKFITYFINTEHYVISCGVYNLYNQQNNNSNQIYKIVKKLLIIDKPIKDESNPNNNINIKCKLKLFKLNKLNKLSITSVISYIIKHNHLKYKININGFVDYENNRKFNINGLLYHNKKIYNVIDTTIEPFNVLRCIYHIICSKGIYQIRCIISYYFEYDLLCKLSL